MRCGARQVGYYVALARRYRDEEFGPRQLEWLARLRHEHANLRAVLEHCLSTPGQGHHALDMATSLWHFWLGGSLSFEGRRYLRRGSNKAIAVRLVIGTRTAETHVQHILVKLGFASRGQVASWLAEQKRQSP